MRLVGMVWGVGLLLLAGCAQSASVSQPTRTPSMPVTPSPTTSPEPAVTATPTETVLQLSSELETQLVQECITAFMAFGPQANQTFDAGAAQIIERPFRPALVVYIPSANDYGENSTMCEAYDWPQSASLGGGYSVGPRWTQEELDALQVTNEYWSS